LYTIAVNHLRSVGRKRITHRRGTTSPYDDAIAVERPSAHYDLPDEVMMRREADRAVQDALGHLKPKYREAFVLFEISGLSVSETAEVLELPENTVKTRLRRARQMLADILTKEGWP
jgi:RNA polymerase sigma-70 factor (ECF subfamily)